MEKTSELIHFIEAPKTIRVELPDGRFIEGPRGCTAESILRITVPDDPFSLMGCIVNGEIRELSYPLMQSVRIQPLTTADPDGWAIYRRSLVYLMSATFEKLFPDWNMTADHPILSGGVFCQVKESRKFTPDMMKQLETEMRKCVEADLPIEKEEIALDDARQIFIKKKQMEKVRLLNYRTKPYLTIYKLGQFQDYHFGFMVPSTGYLRTFAIEASDVPNGYFLRFPHRGDTKTIMPVSDPPKVLEEFQEYGQWLEKLGIDNISAVNEAIEKGRIQEVIMVSEALLEQRYTDTVRKILETMDKTRIVLIAGPSSSGKTTSSKRLTVELLAHGISPVPIEMDNYFVNRENTPRDEKGNYDFEALEAMNIPLLTDNMNRLIHGEEVQLPRYDFKEGKAVPGKVLKLKKDQIMILEGIHGLDPRLLPTLDPSQMYRIFISPLTQLNMDRYNRVSTVDTRLIRRIVRDYRDRGYSAQDTISRWASVRAGEDKNISPYQRLADSYINTSLVYEHSALKQLAELALRLVPFGVPEYVEAKRLLAFFEWVLPFDTDLIPANSIMREFVGGSNLKDFTVWKNM